MSKVYGVAKPSLNIRRSLFDMSYRKLFTTQFGKLVPVYMQDCVPGDIWKGGNTVLIRTQPLSAPLMSSITAYVHYFFVPYRILGSIVGASNPFTASITGYKNGVGYTTAKDVEEYNLPRYSASVLGSTTFTNGVYTDGQGKKHGVLEYDSDSATDANQIPLGTATETHNGVDATFIDCRRMISDPTNGGDYYINDGPRAINTLWDFFGFPTNVDVNKGCAPLLYPWYAYNMIWNEYYRDENIQYPVLRNNNAVLNRCVAKDYFTSALPFQQKGTAPQIVVGGVAPVIGVSPSTMGSMIDDPDKRYLLAGIGTEPTVFGSDDDAQDADLVGTVDSASFSISVNDIRLANSIQIWQETNARCGNRWNEYLRAHYGVSNGDDRINRPVYIGGTKQYISCSEVLNQSGTGTLGDMKGHGISGNGSSVGNYRVKEHGVIMGIMSIMPENLYCSQGIAEEWVKNTRYDWYSPEFADLGEQPIPNYAIFANGLNKSLETFGFQGAWDFMRSRRGEVCSNMRDTFDYWHTARKFSDFPTLSDSFLKCDNENYKRVFQVQDEDGFIVDVHNNVNMIRPLPALSIPRSL